MPGLDFNSRGMETCRGSIPPLWRELLLRDIVPSEFSGCARDITQWLKAEARAAVADWSVYSPKTLTTPACVHQHSRHAVGTC